MHEKSDAQLLREYAERGNETAFHEIVERHTDLIYSSALRQMASPDLARDVAQSVFADLARKAPSLFSTLDENASLLGWLYRSTRFAALTQLRDERRRHARERNVMENFDPTPDTEPDWERVGPVLDEAMADLSEEDREALLLRFFKNRDFRAIGTALGVSDDTAQKRVSRALEKLRSYLTQRNVTTSAVALSTALSANAVQAAPIGFSAMISSAAITGGTVSAAAMIGAGKTIIMTTTQKVLVTTALAAAFGTGVYELAQNSRLKNDLSRMEQKLKPLKEQNEQLRRERDEMQKQLLSAQQDAEQWRGQIADLPKLRGEVTRLRQSERELTQVTAEDNPSQMAVKSLLERVKKLKQKLEETPNAKIPEIQFLTEDDWVNAVRGNLDTEADMRKAFSLLRSDGERRFLEIMQTALLQYIKANNDQFPTELSQLNSYFESSPSDDILQRYKIVAAENISHVLNSGDWLITPKAPVDEDNDTQWVLGRNGLGCSSYRDAEALSILAPAVKAFTAAAPTNTDGRVAFTLQQLLPYLTTPKEKAAYEKLMNHRNSDSK